MPRGKGTLSLLCRSAPPGPADTRRFRGCWDGPASSFANPRPLHPHPGVKMIHTSQGLLSLSSLGLWPVLAGRRVWWGPFGGPLLSKLLLRVWLLLLGLRPGRVSFTSEAFGSPNRTCPGPGAVGVSGLVPCGAG